MASVDGIPVASSPASTLLGPVETNVGLQELPITGPSSDALDSDVGFRHSGWQHDRSLIRDALERVGVSDGRLARWDDCGAYAWVVRHPTDRARLKVMASFCHDRFCKPCLRHRSRTIVANIRKYLRPQRYRYLTLTVCHHDEPLADLVNKLQKSFRRLRATKLCKGSLRGGISFLEVKYSTRSPGWHPHLHIVYEGHYIEREDLQAEWLRITTDSWNVDIRKIPDLDRTVRYVAKYSSKQMTRSFFMQPDLLDEAIVTLSGRRMFTTFGTWRGWPLLACTDTTDWEPVAPLREVREKAARGDTWALGILGYLQRNQKWTHPINPIRDPPDKTLPLP